jgi:hypothetical protein
MPLGQARCLGHSLASLKQQMLSHPVARRRANASPHSLLQRYNLSIDRLVPGRGQVEIKVTGIRCISRAEPLPFELADASRPEADIADKGEAVVVLQARACASFPLRAPGQCGLDLTGLISLSSLARPEASVRPGSRQVCRVSALCGKGVRLDGLVCDCIAVKVCTPCARRTHGWSTGSWICARPQTKPSSACSPPCARCTARLARAQGPPAASAGSGGSRRACGAAVKPCIAFMPLPGASWWAACAPVTAAPGASASSSRLYRLLKPCSWHH